MDDLDLEKAISLHIKSEMAKKGLTANKLNELFLAKGYESTVDSLRGKIKRGTFSFAFYIQFLDVMGKSTMSFELGKTPETTDIKIK
ncbi:MAG: DUF6471 domain-containing protein [Sulfurimonas sp.]